MVRKIFILLVLAFLTNGLLAQNQSARMCTEQDIPLNMRDNYRQYAGKLIEAFYEALPFSLENAMIQDDIVKNYLMPDQTRYMPDFRPARKTAQFLTPSQYLQEFHKQFSKYKDKNLYVEVSDIKFQNDFYAPSMVSCYIIADYNVTFRTDENKIFSTKSRAYCIFPAAFNWITVKLLQIEPVGKQTEGHENTQEALNRIDNLIPNHKEMENESNKIAVGTATGLVLDETNDPQIGASIVVKGTTYGTITDLDGNFSLPGVKKGDVLEISFVGYRTKKVKWEGKPLRIVMKKKGLF